MEEFIAVVAVVGALAIPLLAILTPVFLVLGIVWICQGGRYKSNRAQLQQETLLMQQIHEGLARLDARVESLETILLDAQPRPRESVFSDREV